MPIHTRLVLQTSVICLLLTASRSQILTAPESDPATTAFSSGLNRTASTGLVWPERL